MNDNKFVAVISHCFLNQNAKVSEFARFPGVVQSVHDILIEKYISIIQLPCPETTYLGVNRWWQSRELYDVPGYREFCHELSAPIIAEIKIYLKRGYKVLLVALDGSPSCGVFLTGSNVSWGGRPVGGQDGGSTRISGRGVWMNILIDNLEKEQINTVDFTGLAMDDANFVFAIGMENFKKYILELGSVDKEK